MKKIGIIAAFAAVVCGIAIYFYIGNIEQRIAKAENKKPELEMTNVVVAAQIIPPYTVITEKMLRVESRPVDYTSKDTAKELSQVVGYMADGTIASGEPILTSVLGTSEEIGASLSYEIPDGMRAMTISIGLEPGVGGYLTKGDLIDLMLFLPAAEEGEKEENAEDASGTEEKKVNQLELNDGESFPLNSSLTTTVLESALVLELGDATYNAEEGGIYASLTLALESENCIKLFTAMQQSERSGGAIYATLRQRGDVSNSENGFYSFSELLKEEGAA